MECKANFFTFSLTQKQNLSFYFKVTTASANTGWKPNNHKISVEIIRIDAHCLILIG